MFSMARILASTMAKSAFRNQIMLQPRIKCPKQLSSHNYLPKRNRYVFKDYTFLRKTNAQKQYEILTNWRQKSDKFAEKGRGEELNYFLREAREQFEMIRKRRMEEIKEDIAALEAEVREMDNKTSRRAMDVRKKLMDEIKELKAMLKKFEKSLENEK